MSGERGLGIMAIVGKVLWLLSMAGCLLASVTFWPVFGTGITPGNQEDVVASALAAIAIALVPYLMARSYAGFLNDSD